MILQGRDLIIRKPYNKYYEKEAYFGKPYPGLVDYFMTYPERNVVLDLGCGQGRDAPFLGRIGYPECDAKFHMYVIKKTQ
jgi:SAM-dependent methyltransferase